MKRYKSFCLFSMIILAAIALVSQQPALRPIYTKLADILDVSASSPSDGEALVYSSTTGKWTNTALTTGAPASAHYLTDQAEGGLSAEVVVTANGKSLVTAANYAAMRTLLDLEAGIDFNAYDADLTTYAGITPSANMQSLLGSATYDAARTNLGLAIGTNVQAHDADLTTYAGITPSANAQTLLGETFAQMLASIGAQAADADLTTYAGITPSANAQTILGETFAQMLTSLSLNNVSNTSDATKDAAAAALTNKTGFNGLVVTANTGAVTTGTWSATAIGNTKGGTAQDSSGWTGYPYVSTGTWAADTILSRITGGVKITNLLTYNSEVDNGNSGATKTIDWGAGAAQKITLTDNCTFTFTGPASGVGRFQITLTQDDTGSRNPVWPATVKWSGGVEPTWSTTKSYVDIVTFWYNGTNYFGVASLDFR